MDETDVDPSALLLLNVKDACKRTRRSPASIYRAIASGDLKSLKVGRSRMFTPAQLTDYVQLLVDRSAAERDGLGESA